MHLVQADAAEVNIALANVVRWVWCVGVVGRMLKQFASFEKGWGLDSECVRG